MSKKSKKLKVKPKYFYYENLPDAEGGMYMEPGPKMPNLSQSVMDYYEPYGPEPDFQPSRVQGPIQINPPDTSKVKPGQPLGPQDLQPPKGDRRGANFGNAALLAMSAFDALLPNPVPRQTVVQPQMAYNPMPYGQGSQALMNHGGHMDALGHLITSDENNSPSAKNGKQMKSKKKNTGAALFGFTTDDLPKAKKGKKVKYKSGGIIPDPMSNFNPHQYEYGGGVNGGAKCKEVGPNYPNTDLMEQWLLYKYGGGVNGNANLREVGANYPNTDLMEQWLLYRNGGKLKRAAIGDILTGDPTDPTKPPALSSQERYYQSSARLSHYKDLLNQKLKAKNPQAFSEHFKGLMPLRVAGKHNEAAKYVQDSKWNDYLNQDEVRGTLGEDYNDYLNSIREVNAYNKAQGLQPLHGQIEGEGSIDDLNYGRRFASLILTPSYSAHNVDRGTSYLREYSYNPKTKQVGFTETGDQKLRPSFLSERSTPTITFDHGGVMYNDGGNVRTMWGGSAELESYNPYDGGTIEFNGPSHAQGGIGMAYNGNPVEVEGGEFASRDPEGNLNIFGNMFIPGTKTKFKKAAGAIAKKEKRYDFLKTKGSDLVNNSNPANKFEQLAFNAGKVMMQGGQMGQADLASKKEKLAALQKDMLDMASYHGLDPFEMSKGKMKKAKGGASIPFYQNGGGDPGGSDPTRADRNMNPGNIKYGSFAKKYGAKRDKDGFAIFPDRKTGLKAMEDLLTGKGYKNLSVRQAINKWTDNHPYRYDLGPLTDKTVGDLNRDELDIVLSTMRQGEGTNYGMIPRPVPKTPVNTPVPQIPNPGPFTPYTLPDLPVRLPETPVDPVNPGAPYDFLKVPERNPIPSNVEPLHIDQVLGEIYAAATNKVEPVPAQRYEPQLYTPYQVSFQDRINANQAAFNAQARAVGAGNPAALGTLAAQKYQADSAVYADEFRTNQAIANDITNKNIALVNDANLKNLGIADTQMVRQSQARSNTRALNQTILNSLSSKYAQNEHENKRLAVYENLYDYRFVPQEDGGLSATYFGPNAMFNYDGKSANNSSFTDPSRRISRYDAQGNLKGYSEYDDSELRDQQKLLDLELKKRKLPLLGVPPLNSK